MDDFVHYVDDSVDVAPFSIYSRTSHMTGDEICETRASGESDAERLTLYGSTYL